MIGRTNSCEKVEESFQYSTSEQFTGEYWVDGKPIYQVTCNLGALPNNSTKVVYPNASNVEHVLSLTGIAYTSTLTGNEYYCIPLPYIARGSGQEAYNIALSSQITSAGVLSVTVGTGRDRTNFDYCYATVRYTKTTD